MFPGSYDFSFFGWFSGLGGSGFFLGQPEIIGESAELFASEQLVIQVNKVRAGIKRRIVSAIPGDSGKVAVALIVGDRSTIPHEIQETLRNTGLAHILAISGLHMALVTLTVMTVIRYCMALFPAVALRYPTKKWAICIGFLVSTIYLMLSGAGVATQRAWIMIAVMLLAGLLDRRAITIRSVALAATFILIVNPQNLYSPGFQMSFAAVVALVAGYELLTSHQAGTAGNNPHYHSLIWMIRIFRSTSGYFVGLMITSLIAGTATMVIAAWHFHQIATLGLLTNILAMPIVGFVIMPFALFSILLMPYGFEWIALLPVGIVSVVMGFWTDRSLS